MRCLYLVVFSLFPGLTGCHRDKSDKLFSLGEKEAVVLEQKGGEIFQYWEFRNEPFLWEFNSGEVPGLDLYKDSLEMELGEEALARIIQQEGSVSGLSRTTGSPNDGDLMNSEYVHSGRLGKIRNVNFLEAQLVNYQIARYPLFSHPTEFHGFMLAHDSLNLIRVYFGSGDQPWPPKPVIILEEVKKDLGNGWKLRYHLHNHFEPRSNNYIGILAPSMADAQYYKFLREDFRLENAVITNGFHTVEISGDEFAEFESH